MSDAVPKESENTDTTTTDTPQEPAPAEAKPAVESEEAKPIATTEAEATEVKETTPSKPEKKE